MAWESSNRRAELPADWAARQRRCIEAAGGRCEQILPLSGKRCPRPATDADHRSDPNNHDDLQALCGKHHNDKTSVEAQQGKARKGSWTREPEAHPGRRRA